MSLELEIMVPDGVLLRRQIHSLRAADATGQFGLWPGHEQFLTLLVPCVLTYQDADGREGYAAADGGIVLLGKNRLAVVTREAVMADRLEEVADAAAAMLQARQSRERAARAEFAELQTTLLRQLHEVER